ncbi:aftiphilin-like isoform X1 [Salarias fasciatus]|uniref:aftiphilin-like isoform X1 n=1 Tax=Salarias fasciatus TaxID=181472 RepID=UPI0011765B26|nr:aftiphilin-like isoform X1 [Salarias fasciatus]
MEPDVIRMYSSSPPPMEDGAEEEDDEFGDFGTFSAVPNSISFTEFDTPTTFNQTQALTATSPPELLNNRGVAALGHGTSNGTHIHRNELSKANGVTPANRPDSTVSERTEIKKVHSGSPDRPENNSCSIETADCNGGGPELITNGFMTSDVQGSPSSQSSVHCHITESSVQESVDVSVDSPEEKFADFAVFPGTEVCLSRTEEEDSGGSWEPAVEPSEEQQAASEDSVTDTNRTGADVSLSGPDDTPNGSCNTDRGPGADTAPAQEHMDRCFSQDGTEELKDQRDLSPADSEAARSDDKGSENETETETETETSFGRPLSTDALEEFGDMSTTASAPSPPPLGDTTTPADDSQLAEDDEDFGDFGDAGSFGGQDFADFEQQEEQSTRKSSAPAEQDVSTEQEDDFGDFNSPKYHSGVDEKEGEGKFASFPPSDSFGNFSVAEGSEGVGGWSAFEGQQEEEGESWAAFSTEPSVAPPADDAQEELKEEEEDAEVPVRSDEGRRTDGAMVSLSGRLEKLFQNSFPQSEELSAQEEVVTLKTLLEAPAGAQDAHPEERSSPCNRSQRGGVWTQLQDIHEALGLRYQWGGSHCNKSLLCCLGIDTRNILFTGQKKQPVIVPMYAAGLGMLEPTKEPVKPVSAAEMIASIGQAPPAAAPAAPPADSSSSHSDPTQQEALPPIQFDWSSSGLTNPLDASGGSSLLNLDFFGPVEDSACGSSASIPGVDPELFELTTAKLDAGGSGSRVADAFARLMSTMEKTSTSTRRPRREENLSEEALEVIAVLPDLTFMQAKVLMFPATLTPLGCQATPSQLLAPPTSSN